MRFYDNPPLKTYLTHHGIKGQKWGVRRFQNKDGSYTAEGKKRYLAGFAGSQSSGASSAFAKGGNQSERAKLQAALDDYENADQGLLARAAEWADSTYLIKQNEKFLRENQKILDDLEKGGMRGAGMKWLYGESVKDDKAFEEEFGWTLKEAYDDALDEYREHVSYEKSDIKIRTRYRDELEKMDTTGMSYKDAQDICTDLLMKITEEVDDEDNG